MFALASDLCTIAQCKAESIYLHTSVCFRGLITSPLSTHIWAAGVIFKVQQPPSKLAELQLTHER
jgi:hypothetical protein